MEKPDTGQERGTAVLIAGPTASGKSALALALAERTGGVVLNADSMQVYGDLAVLTARPSDADLRRAPHRLYGHVDADADYSVGHWRREAADALAATWSAGRLPILVGGTGLYFRALTQGLVEVAPIPEAVRAEVRGRAADTPTPRLHVLLAAVDPVAAARIGDQDRQRILRALEVEAATGRPLSAWQDAPQAPFLPPESCVRLVLEVDPEALRQRIDARFLAMLEAGALEEVRRLAARRLDPARTVLKAHGAPALTRHLAGELSLADAVAEGQGDTRRYAKRQRTFFRTQMADWPRAAPEAALEPLLAAVAGQRG
ncbi:tRNA (adenosine(37)-N6)-dimethylallyltransferase MiaA [Xanthobacter sp. V4C-4]|uniref:tRNA (adenosine(37)-N6)-dimethylallyltransferase MiaA n=1 Tax=Xanthobacter cornucopiae TaxID=3119924 RepID=UPI0037279DA6